MLKVNDSAVKDKLPSTETDFGHRENGQKAWSLRAIFDIQISTLKKTEFTEGKCGGTTYLHPA